MIKIKKSVIYLILIILISGTTTATNLYDFETPFKIIKKDYMQEYIDYSISRIDDNTYRLYWHINDPFVFKGLYCNDDDCINKLAKETKPKNFEKNTKKILWFENKYTFNDLKNSYFLDKKTLKKDRDTLKASKIFPKKVKNGNIILSGDVNPIDYNSGEIILYLPGGVYGSEYQEFEIGFKTLIVSFNNSESQETLNLSESPGFLSDSVYRYINIPKFNSINNASINLTGKFGNYSIYDEMDYFNGGLSKWTITNSSPNSGINAKCEATNEADKLKLYCYMNDYTGGGSSSGYTQACYNSANIKNNESILVSFTFLNEKQFLFGEDGYSKLKIFIKDNLANTVELFNISYIDEPCDAVCGGAIDSMNGQETFKFDINDTITDVTIYNMSDNSLYRKKSIIGLTGNTWELCVRNDIKNTDVSSGYSRQTTYIKFMGVNYDYDIYKDYNLTISVYPNQTKFYVGDVLVYHNTTTFDGNKIIGISSSLTSSINSGLCNCTGCVLKGDNCIVPFVFNSSNGGSLFWSNLNVDYTLTTSNLTIFLYDSSTLLPITNTNITIQYIGGAYQQENTTDKGNLSLVVEFNKSTDDVSIVAFESPVNDYSIVKREITINQATNTDVNMYLTNTSDLSLVKEITFKARDENYLNLDGAIIRIYKRNPSTNQFIELTDLTTNANGEASTTLILDEVFYKVVVEYQSSEVYISSNPFPISSYDSLIYLNCIVGESYTDYFLKTSNFEGSIPFTKVNNQTGYYTLSYDSDDMVEVCLDTYYITNTVRTNVSYYCENGTTNSFTSSNIVVTTFSTAHADIYINFPDDGIDQQKWGGVSHAIGINTDNEGNPERLIIFFGLVIVCGVVFVYLPIPGLILFAFGTLIIAFTKFTLISIGFAMFVVALSIFAIMSLIKK